MSKLNGVNGRVKTAAELTQQTPDKIGVVRLQLAQLRRQGLCVDLDVQGTRMGRCKATLAEFGITDKDERAEHYDGGSKIMFALEYYKELRSVETSYRSLLHKYATANIAALGAWSYVTFEAWAEWRAEAEILESRFEVIKRKILRDYEAQKEAYRVREEGAAKRAWTAIKAQKFNGITIRGVVFRKEAEFVDFIVSKSLAKFPSKEKIQANIRIGYRSAVVADMGEIEAERTKRDLAFAKAEAERAAMSEKARAIYDAELELQRARLAEAKTPLDEIGQAVRERVGQAVSGMLESIQKNGSIRGKVAEQVNNLVEIYRLTQVSDDRTLTNRLNELQALVGPVGKAARAGMPERNVDGIVSKLNQILDLTEGEVEGLASVDERLLALEL